MDGFIDPYLSMSSWTYPNLHETSSWGDAATSQLDGHHSEHLVAYGRNDLKPNSSMMAQDNVIRSLPIIVDSTDDFPNPDLKHGLVSEGCQQQHGIQEPLPIQDGLDEGSVGRRYPFAGVMDRGMGAECFGMDHVSMGNSCNDPPVYLQSLAQSQFTSVVPQIWQAYSGSSVMISGQSSLHGFSLRKDLDIDNEILGKGLTDNEIQQPGCFQRSSYEDEALRSSQIASYTSAAGMSVENNHSIQNNQQPSKVESVKTPPSSAASDPASNLGGPSGVAKPRARARRGQATDPHSIAERLRREKIADRMKHLQELVPSSNRTDKASMLDEIIEYVKFLQLQVKVLSMSRLGATGAVVPLITDIHSQGSGNLLLATAADPELPETQESIAFEQEVEKLMESNITAAMQFLQTKGLCLMPVALASAISSRKSPSTTTYKSTKSMLNSIQEENVTNGCNMSAAKEDTEKSSGSARNLKSKA